MNMDDKKIDELINKALQEEQALPEGLSRRLEKQIDTWASTEEKKTRSLTRRRTLYWLSGVAATILLCISFLQYKSSYQAHDRLSDTYTNPKDAAAAAEKALLLLSQNLNKGISQVDNAGQEIDKVNNILNKHLTINLMKLKNIFLILFLCCTSLCFAQDKLFEKYADMDNVTSVFISKKMFDMIPNVESGGLNLMNLKGKINNLQIVTSDKQEVRDQMRKEFSSLISKSHEELMRVKDNDTRASFYIVQNGDLINEMIMLADTDSDYVVIRITGKFTLQDIQDVAKSFSQNDKKEVTISYN